jgi:cell division protein FtsB
VLAIVVGLYAHHALSYLSIRAQAEQQQSIVHNLVLENAQLERQQSSLENPATVFYDARALGMVWPGERPYVVRGLPNR